jgi:CRISPR/Cas system-associated endonuclease Cas1
MEPLRPVVDRKILEFALAHTFTPGDFTINSKGGCRLNPQMAKAVAREISEIKTKAITPFLNQLRH